MLFHWADKGITFLRKVQERNGHKYEKIRSAGISSGTYHVPPIHKALFALYHCEAEYDVFEIPPQELTENIANLKKNLSGFNITIPHKVEIMKHLDRLDEKSFFIRRCQSC